MLKRNPSLEFITFKKKHLNKLYNGFHFTKCELSCEI